MDPPKVHTKFQVSSISIDWDILTNSRRSRRIRRRSRRRRRRSRCKKQGLTWSFSFVSVASWTNISSVPNWNRSCANPNTQARMLKFFLVNPEYKRNGEKLPVWQKCKKRLFWLTLHWPGPYSQTPYPHKWVGHNDDWIIEKRFYAISLSTTGTLYLQSWNSLLGGRGH